MFSTCILGAKSVWSRIRTFFHREIGIKGKCDEKVQIQLHFIFTPLCLATASLNISWNKLQGGYYHASPSTRLSRAVGVWGTGGGGASMLPSVFGKLVKPMYSSQGGRLCSPYYYFPSNFEMFQRHCCPRTRFWQGSMEKMEGLVSKWWT